MYLTTEGVTWTWKQFFVQSKTSTFLCFPPHQKLKSPSTDSVTIAEFNCEAIYSFEEALTRLIFLSGLPMTQRLVVRKKAQNTQHRLFKTTGKLCYLEKCCKCILHRQCKAMPEIFHSDYTKRIKDSISANMKSFWSYVSNSLTLMTLMPFPTKTPWTTEKLKVQRIYMSFFLTIFLLSSI